MSTVRIVLCRPSHPGNIGAAARAMKAMGLSDLRLVAPERYPVKEDQWMATNAVDVLERATVHATLNEAIHDCVAAFALSARPREWSPQVLDVRTAAARALEMNDKVAFVFGNEAAGLTNDEMFACRVEIAGQQDDESTHSRSEDEIVRVHLVVGVGRVGPRFRPFDVEMNALRACGEARDRRGPRRSVCPSWGRSDPERLHGAELAVARALAATLLARAGVRARGGEYPARPAQGVDERQESQE